MKRNYELERQIRELQAGGVGGDTSALARSADVSSGFLALSTWIDSVYHAIPAAYDDTTVRGLININSANIADGFGILATSLSAEVAARGALENTHSTWISSINANVVAEITVRSTQAAAAANSETALENIHSIWISSIAAVKANSSDVEASFIFNVPGRTANSAALTLTGSTEHFLDYTPARTRSLSTRPRTIRCRTSRLLLFK